MSFWKELKRRNVYKVGVAYAIVAWLLIQAASIIFPHLNLPSWATTFVIVILIIGFPIALLLAWAYEVTPEGIKRTKEVPLAESITHLTGQKLNYIVTGLLVVAVAFLAIKVYLGDQSAIEPEAVSTETKQAPIVSEAVKEKKTIAVLPFVDISPDKDQEYFVDGLSEELINCLSKISDLSVIARTSSFTFKGSDKTVQEIASVLNTDHILEGSVRKAGNALRITAQLIRTTDGTHLWSETYNRELKDIFAVQEDIATAVADELKVALGIDRSLRPLGGTDNVKAYEHYVIAQGEFSSDEVSRAIESLDAAISLDPEFTLAWAIKAIRHLQLSNIVSLNQAASELAAGLSAAQKAIEINPDLPEAYIALSEYRRVSGDFIEAELAYRRAFELKPEIMWDIGSASSLYYLAVGHFEKAYEIINSTLQNDPLNMHNRGVPIIFHSILGETKRAEDAYEGVPAPFQDDWAPNLMITFARLSAKETVTRDKIPEIPMFDPIWSTAREQLESPKEALAKIRGFYINNDNLSAVTLIAISMWADYFGDPEFALDVMQKAQNIDAMSILYLWNPVFREVRQLPRFKEFVREIGLVDYWNEFGWPDICHQLDNGDFDCY